jgi:transcriptional antiterminator RfaH
MSAITENNLCWYVVHTHPKQEERTNSNLQSWGLETLTPKLRVNKYNQFNGKLTQIIRPLFPTYIFSRFRFNDLYHRIRFARGVHSLVCFNNKPATLDDDVVELVRSRMGTDGFVRTTSELKPGDEVVIKEGRFQDLGGVFERELPDAERVRILLNTIGFQAHVVVDRHIVSKVVGEEPLYS